MSYQWKFNNATVVGATNSSFTKANARLTDAGDYSVVVSNALGSIESQAAVLTVNLPPPPQLQPLIWAGGGTLTISWSAISGRTYRAQFASSLNPANWSNLAPDVTATGPTASLADNPNGAPQRFYRARHN